MVDKFCLVTDLVQSNEAQFLHYNMSYATIIYAVVLQRKNKSLNSSQMPVVYFCDINSFLFFRFGHTMIPPGIYRRRLPSKTDGKCEFVKARNGGTAMRLCSTWWDAEGELTPEAVDEILLVSFFW